MSNIFYQRPNRSSKNEKLSEPQQVYTGKIHGFVKELVVKIVLIVLSFTFVLGILGFFVILNEMDTVFERDTESFWWNYESGRYADCISYKYENMCGKIRTTDELEQCYAVADYFEAASLYRAALHTGDTDKAEKWLAVMEETYQKLGDVAYLADEIKTKLKIADTGE